MTTTKRCPSLVFLLLALGSALAAQAGSDEPVVYADHKSIGENALRAQGHVEVLWKDYVIYADAIDFDLETRELSAEGRVTMASKDMVLSGEKLVFNFKTQRGELLETYGMVSPTVRYETDRLEQTDRETLTFRRLDFTSCAQVSPRWSIRSRKGKIKKDKYIEMSGVVLRLKSLPVFYLPYMRYPLTKDGRATGLLFPNIGNSDLRGFFLQNSFYWAIRPNIDMTLGLDYFARLGIGASDELRYLFRRAAGSARLYYFTYREGNGIYEDTDHDYYVEANHQQTLPFLDSRLVLNVNRQSRPGFLRLFDSNFDLVRSANFQSELALKSSFSGVSVSLSASRRETYYVFKDSSLVIEYLPSLAVSVNQKKVGRLPGYFSLAADYQSVRRSGITYEEEPEFVSDFRSRRLTVTPSYQLPLLRLPWMNSSLKLSSKSSVYAKSLDPVSGQVVDEPLYMRYHTVQFSLQGPVFYRLFGGETKGWKHLIEPEFTVRYATAVNNRDRLVKVDRFDYPSFSYAGFSLTSRLLRKGRGGGAASEILTYSLSQQYYFDPAEANFFMKINGEYPRFSQLSNSLRFRPGGDFVFDASLAYNYYIRGLARLNLSASYNRAGRPLTGSVSYTVYRNPYREQDFELNRSVLGSALHFDLRGFPLKLHSRVDYDFTERRLLHGSLTATFDYQCLLFNVECKLFSYLGESRFQIRAGLSFGNLGMVGDFFGGT
ncbi:MAG: LPS-assembly protein LptD [Candidatus Aminicenantes bacterium]|nr:LPS-assembly protein LptD [Candidatus Aminicenantes bacterium]